MRHTFETQQWLPLPLEQVFLFFADPRNLPPLMPPWQRARIEEATLVPPPPRPASVVSVPPRAVIAGAGTRMAISFRAFPLSPVRIPWEAEITEFVWNDHFCDTQHRGPFRYWLHCHRLEEATRDGQPGTLLTDHLTYEFPLGPLGDLANVLGGQAQIRSIFEYRHRTTRSRLGLPPAQDGPSEAPPSAANHSA